MNDGSGNATNGAVNEANPNEQPSATNGGQTVTIEKEGITEVFSQFLKKFEESTGRFLKSMETPKVDYANTAGMPRYNPGSSPPPLSFMGNSDRTGHGYNFTDYSFQNSDRRSFGPELNVIDRQQQRAPGYASVGRDHEFGNHLFTGHGAPNPKLPAYDGVDEIEIFLIPFERLANRYGWRETEKIDRLYQCLQGRAMRFVCSLPHDICASYPALRGSLVNRFGQKDPPATVRKKLSELKQTTESNEEFAEEIGRMATRAFPGISMDMQDQLAAEAFLGGYKKPRIAYEVLNRAPETLKEALEMVTMVEHNYRATVGRDDIGRKDRTRRVSWADPIDSDEDVCVVQRVQTPTYVTVQQLDNRVKRLEEMFAKFCENKGFREAPTEVNQSRPQIRCYGCGKIGHIREDCPNRSRSPSPVRKTKDVHESATATVAKPTEPTVKVTRLGNSSKSIVIPISVNEIESTAVVDTGADVTVISTSLAREAGLDVGETPTCRLLNAESGAEMKAYGGVTVTLQVAKKKWQGRVFVAPIRDKVLLGMDFMEDTDATVLAKLRSILVDGQLVGPCADSDVSLCSSVAVASDVLIPAESEVITGWGDDPYKFKLVVFDPGSLSNGFYVGSVLANIDEKAPVRVLNWKDNRGRFRGDTHVGNLVEVSEGLVQTTAKKPESEADKTKVLEHVTRPLESSSSGVEPVPKLLSKCATVFTRHDGDLGRSDKVSHIINTGASIPIKQSARKPPSPFQVKEASHCDKTIASDVVVCSTSDWLSPDVLKRNNKYVGLRCRDDTSVLSAAQGSTPQGATRYTPDKLMSRRGIFSPFYMLLSEPFCMREDENPKQYSKRAAIQRVVHCGTHSAMRLHSSRLPANLRNSARSTCQREVTSLTG